MADTLRLAVAQMCSADTHAENIATMQDLAAEAAGQGAEMLALPEVAGLMNRNRAVAETQVVDAAVDPFIAACRDTAAAHGLWIHNGSTPVRAPDGRFLNHTSLVDDTGAIRQSNFHDYRAVSFRDAPRITVEILDSPDAPVGGVGEISTPGIAPAVANAMAAMGDRPTDLPLIG